MRRQVWARVIAAAFGLSLLSWPLGALELGSVTGRIVDLLGEPISGVSIEVQGNGGRRSTTTDTGGRFQIDSLPTGEWKLEAQSDGFAAETRTFFLRKGEQERVDIGLGVLKLTDMDPCELVGFVRDETGMPLGASTVSVIAAFNDGIRRDVLTDAAGRFEVGLENPGQYVLYAHRPGFAVGATALVCRPTLPRPRLEISLALSPFDVSLDGDS